LGYFLCFIFTWIETYIYDSVLLTTGELT